jgi:hypothetical protein
MGKPAKRLVKPLLDQILVADTLNQQILKKVAFPVSYCQQIDQLLLVCLLSFRPSDFLLDFSELLSLFVQMCKQLSILTRKNTIQLVAIDYLNHSISVLVLLEQRISRTGFFVERRQRTNLVFVYKIQRYLFCEMLKFSQEGVLLRPLHTLAF